MKQGRPTALTLSRDKSDERSRESKGLDTFESSRAEFERARKPDRPSRRDHLARTDPVGRPPGGYPGRAVRAGPIGVPAGPGPAGRRPAVRAEKNLKLGLTPTGPPTGPRPALDPDRP